MNEENESSVVSYLNGLVVSSVIRNRVLEIEEYYAELLSGRVAERIYVSETIDGEGQRILENLWFFFPEVWCEAHNFQVEDNFDVTRVGYVTSAVLERNEYKTGMATTRSRLALRFKFGGGETGTLKASGENCNALADIMQEQILPRLLTGGGDLGPTSAA